MSKRNCTLTPSLSWRSKKLGKVIEINEAQIHDNLGELVRGTVEETLNSMLETEADSLCNAARYERSDARKKNGSSPKRAAVSMNIIEA